MRRLCLVLVALALPAALSAADGFLYRLTFPDGVPGVMRASIAKDGDAHSVSCTYAVSQEEEMDLPDMPLGSWRGTGVQKVDRDAVRALCLEHYEDALPRD